MICPHCHKDTDAPPEVAAPKAKRKRVPRNVAFEKQPLPGPGQAWSWHTCYFNVGDDIRWSPTCPRLKGDRSVQRGEIYTDKVAKVKMNQYGRISYYNQYDDLILTEEVQRAHSSNL